MKREPHLRDATMAAALGRDLERYARHVPVAYDVDRGLERLTASLALTATAVGGGAPAATGLKALVTKALALSSLPAAKVVAVCLVVGAAGGMVGARAARETRPSVAPIASPPHSPAPVAPRVDVSPTAPSEPETPAPAAPAPILAPRAVVRAAARASKGRREEPREADLGEEIAALVHLREVASRDPAAAVALAAEDDARFGRGGLYGEEREAIAVLALSRSGRNDEACARGRAFLARHPKSPFASLVRGAANL